MTRILRVGIGGPVGSGKSMLIERVVPILAKKNYRVCIISNDVISKEDADRIRKNLATDQGLLPENMGNLPANHRRSILNHDVLSDEDIEEYYQRFTTIREKTYLERYGKYLNQSEKTK